MAMIDNYRLLLERAGRLYAKHDAGRPEPFNVFSVLDIERDEVNCHSRFLKALLDYEKSGDETRENLTDFLHCIDVEGFEQRGVKIEQERDKIDILITNDARSRQAVVIENKIGAPDQWRQLCRYYNTLKDQSYVNIHLRYLKLDGSPPSDVSFCGPDCEARSRCKSISYRNTLSWLKRCQQRAYDEPELRESVAQYRRLVQKLTGTDRKGAYMNELMKLCLEDDNLDLLDDLNKALSEATFHLVQKLLCDIEVALKEEIPDLPDKDDSRGSRDLYFPLGGGAFLCVLTSEDLINLSFGVKCVKDEHPERYNELNKALENANNPHWPWRRRYNHLKVKEATPKELMQLMEPKRKEHTERIARDLKPLWEALKAAGLVSQNP